MRRAGGVFVAGFVALGAIQAVTGFVPSVPSAMGAPRKAEVTTSSSAFTGTSAPVKDGTVPNQFEGLVNKWGNKCKALTPALLAAQLNQESGFKSGRSVVSSANAKGIAQFIPSTWATHGVDGNGDGKKDIWDPEDAIPSAASYDCELASYVRKVPGDQRRNMLAAYNAGAGRVIRAGGVPAIAETRNYVRSILAAAGRFER